MSNFNFPTNDKREYYREEYLKSDHWKQLRLSKLSVVKFCECCGSRKRLDVHHLYYGNLYDVTLEDLMVLCRGCHEWVHNLIDNREFTESLFKRQDTRKNVHSNTVIPSTKGKNRDSAVKAKRTRVFDMIRSKEFKEFAALHCHEECVEELMEAGLSCLSTSQYLRILKLLRRLRGVE